jgi:MFS family permease
MIIGMAGGALGMAGAYFGRSPAIFVMSFVIAGMGVGFAYVGSLFYSLCAPQHRRGRRCGVHEMMVGAGGGLGPLLAGTVATYWGVRASFGVEGLIFAAAMVVFVGYSLAGRLRSST